MFQARETPISTDLVLLWMLLRKYAPNYVLQMLPFASERNTSRKSITALTARAADLEAQA